MGWAGWPRRASRRRGARFERAADEGGAFGHADHAGSGAGEGGRAAVDGVVDSQHDVVRGVGDPDVCRCGAMFQRVGEGFLDDAVCRQVDRGGKFAWCAGDVELGGHSGLDGAFDQGIGVGEAQAGGLGFVALAFLAQQADHGAHLVEPLHAVLPYRFHDLPYRGLVEVLA